MASLSPLGSPIRGSAYRNRTANRARGRGEQNPWTPALLAPYAWYDVHAGGTSSTIADKSGNGRADATYGATTAAPQYLPYTGTAYLHLEAATSGTNSLSCTAPANTASYAAYPLGGGAATTGAASSGAFTFTTAGDWIQLDLLNGSGSVLASFRASDSGQTGHTDAFTVVWTINRGTAGGKSALVNRRSLALIRTNDYIDVPAAAVPSISTSSTASFVVVGRLWATPIGFRRVLSVESATNNGMSVQCRTTGQLYIGFGDGSATGDLSSGPTLTLGQRTLIRVEIAQRSATGTKASINNAATVSASNATVGNPTVSQAAIGAYPAALSFQDLEFEALLTFGRSLSSTEIAQLVTYYGAG